LALKDKKQFSEDIYTNLILDAVKELEPSAKVVISDLRFPAELEAFSRFCNEGGHSLEVWRVIRSGQLASPVKDISEHYFDGLANTKVLKNPGTTLLEYEKNVSKLI
jgi:hypothetical protein